MLKKMDKICCRYLGLESEIVSPNAVEIQTGQLIVLNTESFNHHSYSQNWKEFSAINYNQLSKDNKEKLGIAIGRVKQNNLQAH